MQPILIGCGQITWHGSDKPEDEVLAEIARAGYDGAPIGRNEGVPPAEVAARFAKHGLRPAPGYLGADFWDPAAEADILAAANDYGALSQALGLTELYVAAGGFTSYRTARGQTRMQIAGHVAPEDAMTDTEFAQFARVLNQVGAITLEYGVSSCFHNHVGSTIETRAEIDRLFALVDPNLVFMGPDTGHLAWAGEDALQFIRDYASAIKTIHVKDIDEAVRVQGVAAGWDYMTFTKHGIWTELGRGLIDFPAVFAVLEGAGFDGWIIVETDDTQLPTPYASAVVSREYLKTLGM
jgi:inosose dehydratase